MRQTRKQKKITNKIQHHHLLLRMETKRCPGEEDKQKAKELVDHIIHDISMKPLGDTRVFYVKNPTRSVQFKQVILHSIFGRILIITFSKTRRAIVYWSLICIHVEASLRPKYPRFFIISQFSDQPTSTQRF
jgi:hypothetical protein